MICINCNKNKVTVSKIIRPLYDGLAEVEIMTTCVFCRSKKRQIENINNELYILREKMYNLQMKLTDTEYKYYCHIHS